MKLEKLLDSNIVTGVLVGVIIGLYFPMEAYKTILVVGFALMVGLKVLTSK